MFQQFIAIIRGSYYLRSYSSNICVGMYMDYNLFGVTSCREMRPRSEHNHYMWYDV
jgi:hypothetical protein